MQVRNVIIVGLGGVGTRLAHPICQYLAYKHRGMKVLLIDGDVFEPKNADRQVFAKLGNKAEVVAAELSVAFPELTIEAKPKFITADNVFVYVKEGSLTFCCVDNHASRKLLSEHCGNLSDTVLISGGNDFDDGNIQVYARKNGADVTAALTYLHPEIETPRDKNPAELSCAERAATSTPQLLFANFKVASEMANAFYLVVEDKLVYSELYFDLKTGAQRPILRKEQNNVHRQQAFSR